MNEINKFIQDNTLALCYEFNKANTTGASRKEVPTLDKLYRLIKTHGCQLNIETLIGRYAIKWMANGVEMNNALHLMYHS